MYSMMTKYNTVALTSAVMARDLHGWPEHCEHKQCDGSDLAGRLCINQESLRDVQRDVETEVDPDSEEDDGKGRERDH